ncbi:amino acid adenylation domain-containing protein [Saccharothrix sp. S26]|uniref:non-ribosomal peptide synthetase n=1 Tax=Saccharothrix sp. S26 TaxID=2907215 RepID=UPI001F2A8B3E|nr:non-ribosomal peptide synthetase [Saccharothrix sp. S26]MCE6999214.1 amino acid adenylation domain-containing protein [Saccharothrix sp. S26]
MTFTQYATAVLGPEVDTSAFTTRSFIGLGGDSLRAMRLAALVQERLGVRIPVAALLGDAPLAEVLAEAGVVTAPAEPAPTDDAPAESLSHAQRGMWLIERLTGGSPYNLVFTCFVVPGTEGRLDGRVFERAVAATVARHPGLRTVYREVDGDVATEVLDHHTAEITAVAHEGDGFEEHVRALAAEHGRLPFDLAAAPAFRFLRVTGTRQDAVVLMAHHMVLDGWAVGLLLKELFAHYDALALGQAAPFTGVAPSTRALLRHQKRARAAGEWDRQAEFWIKHLDGVPTVLELPADCQRPALQDAAGDRTTVDFGLDTSAAVLRRARELGITPFAFLLGAYGLTLSRWTGTRRLLVGVPLTGRGSSELEELIAVAGNLVPVRIDVDDDAPVADYLRAVHHSLAQSIDAGSLPFEELVSRLGVERSLGCHPLVQATFGMHDQLVPQRLEAAGLEIRVEEGHGGGSQFDLSLLIRQSEPTLAGHLEYATAVWGVAEVEGFVADFQAAAAELAAAGGALEEVRCVAPERRASLDRINETRRDFPVASLDELFRDIARSTPDAVAVREGDVELTYRQLADAAAHQAGLLREAGVRPGDRVLVGVERSVAEVVAVLGVVWAGAAYVGVDLGLPAAHTAKIVAKAAPTAALIAQGAADRVPGVPVVSTWDATWTADGTQAPDGPDVVPGGNGTRAAGGSTAVSDPAPTGVLSVDPDRLAYVAFTSGSTGQPKGVAIPHRAVVRLVHEADFVRLGAGERVLRLSPLAFDASTLELWGALLTGAALEVHPAGLPTPSELGDFLLEREVTVAWLTAGLFRLVEEFAPDSFAGLRQLLSGGDVVPHDHVARVLRRHPGLVVTNGYGPTENTTFTTTYSVSDPEEVDGPLPIGTPLPGTRVYVLDERGRRVPPGAVGELYAAGEGLAVGYLDDEAETARAFGHFSPEIGERLYRTGDVVRLDTRGRLRFLGRRDDQVKLRGYRVELSAISDALVTHPDVHDAVVTVTGDNSADKRLVAAVVLKEETGTAELRDFLSERLPAYMVPVLWAVVDRIPLTGNGKVDRRALVAQAAPAGHRAPKPVVADRGADEGLVPLFVEAIGGQPTTAVDADTDFFVVGGNSMGAVRLVKLVKDRLGVTLRLRDFLRTPTPAGLRQLVDRAGAK